MTFELNAVANVEQDVAADAAVCGIEIRVVHDVARADHDRRLPTFVAGPEERHGGMDEHGALFAGQRDAFGGDVQVIQRDVTVGLDRERLRSQQSAVVDGPPTSTACRRN
ncbi:MAG: hypothetical protein QM742_09685 [Aquabacterium sp.]